LATIWKTLSNTFNANCEKKINRHNVTQLVGKWAYTPVFNNFAWSGIVLEDNFGYACNLSNFGTGPTLAAKLNLADGSVVWEAGTVVDPVPELNSGVRYTPAIGKDYVYYGCRGFEPPSDRPKIVALNKNDGSFVWEASLELNPLVPPGGLSQPNSPIIYVEEDDIVIQATVGIVGGTFGSVQAFDANTGAQLWGFKTTE